MPSVLYESKIARVLIGKYKDGDNCWWANLNGVQRWNDSEVFCIWCGKNISKSKSRLNIQRGNEVVESKLIYDSHVCLSHIPDFFECLRKHRVNGNTDDAEYFGSKSIKNIAYYPESRCASRCIWCGEKTGRHEKYIGCYRIGNSNVLVHYTCYQDFYESIFQRYKHYLEKGVILSEVV